MGAAEVMDCAFASQHRDHWAERSVDVLQARAAHELPKKIVL
jgi:hypothetical protein